MPRISFDRGAQWNGGYVLIARLDGTPVRCIATRRVLVDCLGPAIATAGGEAMVRRAEACRPTLEYAFRNKLLSRPDAGRSERALVLTHETFLHWANCMG